MEERKIIKKRILKNEDVYDITTTSNHNFFANGILIHNCGEVTLPSAGVCNLGSINLTQFLKDDNFDYKKLKKYIEYAVRFLDNINDISNFPIEIYKKTAQEKRRVGLGILGWGSSLLMMKIKFGSKEADIIREKLLQFIYSEAYKASINLAEEKGMFKYCNPEKHAIGKYVERLGLSTKYINKMKKYGIRNSTLGAIAPNGNTSILANVVSGGLEPIFMPEYVRTVIVNKIPKHIKDVTPKYFEGEWFSTKMFKKTKEGDEEILRGVDEFGVVYKIDKNRGLTKEVLCEDYGVNYLKEKGEWDPSADWVMTTNNLTAQEHLKDLAGFAKYIDQSCSKTINVPNNYNFKKFKDIYLDAYETGHIKGVTTYRAGTMTNVLAAKDEKNATSIDEEIIKEDVKMPDSANAVVKTIRAENRKWYLTIVYHEDNVDRPFALFVKTNSYEKNVIADEAVDVLIKLARKKKIPKKHIDAVLEKIKSDNNSSKITRLISLLLRHGAMIKYIVQSLDKVKDIYVGSFVYQIRKFLASFIKDGEEVDGEKCTECSGQIIYSEGCFKCTNCGLSKC